MATNEALTTPIKAGPGDHRQIGRILAAAFHDDPVNLWVMGGLPGIEHLMKSLARDVYLPRGTVHVAEADAGAAMWTIGGMRTQFSTFQTLRFAAGLALISGTKFMARGTALGKVMAAAKPREPHAYLFAIGVVPSSQGKGVGGALMRAGLALVDDRKLPAYLESSKESNIPIYRHYGFEVLDPLPVPEGCPPIWPMWRAAKPN